jgi:D-glycero-D-manno-heptose 1,7-bisphosphate phosphatase
MGVGAIGVRRAVFLDRDGVLNRAFVRDGKPYPPGSLAELEVVAGAGAALSALAGAGFLLFVVTNQPDVARGTQRRAEVEAMHAEMARTLPVDGFYVCYHDDKDGCDCRKPLPGLLTRAADEHGVALEASYMIGDRWRDVEAGQKAGCRTVWIDCGYAERGPKEPADATVGSLAAAVSWILEGMEGLRG